MPRLTDTSAWDTRYRTGGALWGYFPAVSAEETWWRLRETGARRVLVVGCGYGRHVAYFARRGLDTTGLDTSRAAIDMAHQSAREDGLDLVLSCASATRMPFPDASFDAVYDHALLHHLSAEDRVLAVGEYRRVLRPGGLLVLSALSTDEDAYAHADEADTATAGEESAAASDDAMTTGRAPTVDGQYFDDFFDTTELGELLEDFNVESVIDLTEADETSPHGTRRFVRAIARRHGDAELASRRRDPWGGQGRRYRIRRKVLHE
jgi:SAM-dependent methyltransferase